ncbi:siderophore ABC transporter substrate-binding protein [Kingella sp. (in: b-proteobacteria)]|uniref:siderophore ABC transporter substrate-binding protein n=1 Tax=Kingella sp. (in: b-proteobacteria) TaxID=2020713 RepID=UPI0026DB1C4D|nr:siderophore ABC transporter substrate-binding protein [Kingella sp. (in: b-proteobacteria)]MDO4656564.1 siderophore ABC transporter substrate-binding protein [Kingella sp. (in: b-proteobacteria)]
MKHSLIALLTFAALTACNPSQQQSNQAASQANSASAASQAQGGQAEKDKHAPLKAHDIQGEKVTVKTARGDTVVPKNPQNVAVYDLGALDTLTALGVPVGATIDKSMLPYLQGAFDKAQHVGTLFEPNYEALGAFKPQLIIIGSRTSKAAQQLNEIAPTIDMTADTQNLRTSAEERIDAYAQIFGKQAEADKLKADINQAFDAARTAAQGKGKGLVIIVSGGKLSAQSPTSRLGGWLHQDIGLPPVDANMKEGVHGMPISFEYIKEKNPDWLFVLDRSAAIGEEGKAAKDVLDNPLVAESTAWKKGQVVYLDSNAYLAAGGAKQLQTVANQAAEAFKKAK